MTARSVSNSRSRGAQPAMGMQLPAPGLHLSSHILLCYAYTPRMMSFEIPSPRPQRCQAKALMPFFSFLLFLRQIPDLPSNFNSAPAIDPFISIAARQLCCSFKPHTACETTEKAPREKQLQQKATHLVQWDMVILFPVSDSTCEQESQSFPCSRQCFLTNARKCAREQLAFAFKIKMQLPFT